MKETGLERRVQFRQVHERGQLFRRNEFSINVSIVWDVMNDILGG